MNSQLQQTQSRIIEISGRPGQVWGSTAVPAGGRASLRINGDVLHATTADSHGLETKEIYVRIQNIDSVEVVEGRIWWLLILGFATVFWVIGILLIVLFFIIKQRWIVVHSGRTSLIVFLKDTNQAKQFSQNLLAMARQLNSPAVPRSNPAANSRQPQTSQRPTSSVNQAL